MASETFDVLLVGYENQENLGLRYIASYLVSQGRMVLIQPFSPGHPEAVLAAIQANNPVLVGFSLIFQYTLGEFGELLTALRQAGVRTHFTAGGHFPSLRPEQTLALLPELDSIVRFEGEETTYELMEALQAGRPWQNIRGLAFRSEEGCRTTTTRPLTTPLDRLPWPLRSGPDASALFPSAPMLASRGCLYDCAFCSIREFYRGTQGAPRRSRTPQDVTAEMRHLFERFQTRVFLFQDDDFVLKGAEGRRWVEGFLDGLEQVGLKGEIAWKISARVDDIVDADMLGRCRDFGLMAVYLGIESGSAEGLRTLNKRATVAQNLQAIAMLQACGIAFDLGFMLFDPGSTFATVRENLAFLHQIAAMEGPPLAFVKMLPLAGTAIERRLREEGRLIGTDLRPDYRLQDPRLEYFALFTTLAFSHRNSDPEGFVERFRQAYFAALLSERFGGGRPARAYRSRVAGLIRTGNESALALLQETLDWVEQQSSAKDVALLWPQLRAAADEGQAHWQELMGSLEALGPVPPPHLPSHPRPAEFPALDLVLPAALL